MILCEEHLVFLYLISVSCRVNLNSLDNVIYSENQVVGSHYLLFYPNSFELKPSVCYFLNVLVFIDFKSSLLCN